MTPALHTLRVKLAEQALHIIVEYLEADDIAMLKRVAEGSKKAGEEWDPCLIIETPFRVEIDTEEGTLRACARPLMTPWLKEQDLVAFCKLMEQVKLLVTVWQMQIEEYQKEIKP